MSRIGKNPVVLPKGVEITVGDEIIVKGPLGSLKTAAHSAVKVEVEGENGVDKMWIITKPTYKKDFYSYFVLLTSK